MSIIHEKPPISVGFVRVCLKQPITKGFRLVFEIPVVISREPDYLDLFAVASLFIVLSDLTSLMVPKLLVCTRYRLDCATVQIPKFLGKGIHSRA